MSAITTRVTAGSGATVKNAPLTNAEIDTNFININTDKLEIGDTTSLNTAGKVVKRDSLGNFSAGTITAALSGNASTATALQTARTISLSGDASGSVSFDGTANANITVVVADDSHLHSIDSLSDEYRLFNNSGDNHGTRTSFDAQGAASSVNFGWRFVQGTTNSPGTNGATQYYSEMIGLGNDYAYNTYGMQLAIPRNVTTPYISVRYQESGAFQAWQKIAAGYADTAGALTTGNSYQIGSLGVGTAASGTAGEIRATNNITAYYSDRRLKDEISKIENALDKVDQLTGVLYTQNKLAEEYGYNNYEEQVGLYAQDVQKVQPQAVKPAPFDIAEDGSSKSGENYLTIQYDRLVPLLVEAIKELRKEINDLKGNR